MQHSLLPSCMQHSLLPSYTPFLYNTNYCHSLTFHASLSSGPSSSHFLAILWSFSFTLPRYPLVLLLHTSSLSSGPSPSHFLAILWSFSFTLLRYPLVLLLHTSSLSSGPSPLLSFAILRPFLTLLHSSCPLCSNGYISLCNTFSSLSSSHR